MATILIGLACFVGGLAVRHFCSTRCEDCWRALPRRTHCEDCIALWKAVNESNMIHARQA